MLGHETEPTPPSALVIENHLQMLQKVAQSQDRLLSSKLTTQPQTLSNNTLNCSLIEVWVALVD